MECAYLTIHPSNQKFLDDMRKTLRRQTGSEPSLATVLNTLLAVARERIEHDADPDFVRAYRSVCKRRA